MLPNEISKPCPECNKLMKLEDLCDSCYRVTEGGKHKSRWKCWSCGYSEKSEKRVSTWLNELNVDYSIQTKESLGIRKVTDPADLPRWKFDKNMIFPKDSELNERRKERGDIVFQVLVGIWIAVSPYVFGHREMTDLSISNLICGTVVVVLGLVMVSVCPRMLKQAEKKA